MITRDEFTSLRNNQYLEMQKDGEIQQLAIHLLEKGIQFGLPYQTNWFGEPIIQYPQDLFAIQEIIYKTRPDYIIEIGTAWAGSLLFYSTLLTALGGKKVIGVDIFMPDDLIERIKGKGEIATQINLICGSSLDKNVIDEIEAITGKSKKVFIHLDSNHTTDHVLRELEIYSEMVGEGMYILCGDTHVELLKDGAYPNKEYGKGNNPMIAVQQFLKSEAGVKFEIDEQVNGKYLISLNPRGFLRKK